MRDAPSGLVRVLQIVAAPKQFGGRPIGVNGPERRAANAIRHWRDHGVEAVVAYPRHGRMWQIFESSGCALDEFELGGKGDVNAVRRIRALIRRYGPHVVHTQGPESLDAFTALAAGITRRPHVITRPLMTEQLLHVGGMVRQVYRAIDSVTLKLAQQIVTVSQAGYEHLTWGGAKRSGKVRLIYNGVDLERFQPASPPSRAKLRIAMAAQLTPPKGWYDFLKVAQTLLEDVPELEAWVIGDGPLRAELEEHSRQEGLQGAVRFIGHSNDMPRILREIDLFVMTSHREGLSVAILEAMAAGLPIVATDTGGTKEQVLDGVNGYVVPVGNVPELACRTRTLLTRPEMRVAFGQASRRRAETLFSQQAMIAAYAALYHECRRSRGQLPL